MSELRTLLNCVPFKTTFDCYSHVICINLKLRFENFRTTIFLFWKKKFSSMKETFVSKIYAMQLKVFFCKIFDMKSVGRICTRYFFRKKGNLVDHAWLQTKLGYLCNLQLILYGKPSYSKRWKTKKYQIRWKKGKFHIPQNPSAGQLAVLFLHEKNSLRQWQDNTKKI